jgi:hypothetical protein
MRHRREERGRASVLYAVINCAVRLLIAARTQDWRVALTRGEGIFELEYRY